MLFWENEVLAKVVGVFEFYGRENAVRRQWEREEKWDYLNGCLRNEKAWDEEGELQCKIYVSKKRGLDRDQKMEVMKLYETVEDRKVREAVRVICG